MKKILLIVAVLALAGCTNEPHATGVLEGAGYRDITFTGYSFFLCGESDTYATGFKATGPTGKPVSGAVCSGLLLKGSTIRMD